MRIRGRWVRLLSCAATATMIAVAVGIVLVNRAENQPVKSVPPEVYFADLEQNGTQLSEVESNHSSYFRRHQEARRVGSEIDSRAGGPFTPRRPENRRFTRLHVEVPLGCTTPRR